MGYQDLDIEELARKLSVGFWSVRLDGERKHWTRAISEMHGLPHDPEPPFTYGARAITSDHWDAVRKAFADCTEAGIAYDIEVEIERPDGQIRWVRMYGEPIRSAHGDIVGARGTMQDIHRWRGEAQTDSAASSDTEVAGDMAHALNNLLTVILSNSAIIATQSEEPDVVELAQSTLEASHRAAGIANAMLLYSGRSHLLPAAVDLGTLVPSFRETLIEVAGDSRLRIITTDGAVAELDPFQFEECLQALVRNASEANASRIDIQVTRESDRVVIEVRDDGDGIEPTILDRATAPFVTTKPGTGRGTGLTLCDAFARRSSGTFTVDSDSRGTVACFRFERSDALAERYDELGALPSDARALVVDDDEEVLRGLAKAVRSCGFTVITANHGDDAVRLLSKENFDVLVTDIVMPDMSGRELAERARSLHPELPIVFASARTRELWDIQNNGDLDAPIATVRKPAGGRRLRTALLAVLTRSRTDA